LFFVCSVAVCQLYAKNEYNKYILVNSSALKGNCHEKFLLQNMFGFHIYITNICIKLSTETVIIKNNFVDKSVLHYK